MNERQLSYQDVLEIIKLVEGSDKFSGFKLRYDGVEIEMNRGAGPVAANGAANGAAPVLSQADVGQTVAGLPTTTAEVVHDPTPVAIADATPAEGMVVVTAPMVGTFYRAPEPGAQPFVEVGDTVDVNDTVCILEVMKLMNTLSAEVTGVVREILVADGATVEYGQPLIVIDPS